MLFVVYKHTSRTSRKSYVGYTSKTMMERWFNHVKRSREFKTSGFHSAIRKYGVSDFDHEIIEVMTTLEGVLKAEQLWIKELKTITPNGYNLTSGGEGYSVSEETRLKLSAARRGRELSKEHKRKLGLASKGNKSHLGKALSAQHRKSISDTLRGKKRGKRGPNKNPNPPASAQRRLKASLAAKRQWEIYHAAYVVKDSHE